MAVNALYGLAQLGVAQATGGNLDAAVLSPITGGASQINIFGAIEGANVYRPNALTGDPNHLGIELVIPLLVLLPIYLRLERGHRLRVAADAPADVPVRDGARHPLPQRHARARSRAWSCSPCPTGASSSRSSSCCRSRRRRRARGGRRAAGGLLPDGAQLALSTRAAQARPRTSSSTRSSPTCSSQNPLFGLGLNTFSVYYEFVTGRDNFGPHSFYVALFVETGLVGALLFAAFLVYLFRRLAVGRAGRPGARRRRRHGRRSGPPARLGPGGGPRRHDGRERLLPDDVLLLLLRVRAARRSWRPRSSRDGSARA